MHVKSGYDVEDMIGDVVMHVWRVRAKYDAKRAKEVTWVYWVADRKCQAIVQRYRAKKRTMEITEGDAPADGQTDRTIFDSIAAPDNTVDMRNAKDAVERVIETGSDATRDFLDRLFGGKPISAVPAYELTTLARRCGVTCRDFEMVYRRAVV